MIGTLNDFTLSLYLVYYGFNASDNCNGLCYLNQDVILERMGFSASGQNLDKLRFANALLRSNGLIRQAYEITKDSNGREVKRKLITVVPKYWKLSYMMKLREVFISLIKAIKLLRNI